MYKHESGGISDGAWDDRPERSVICSNYNAENNLRLLITSRQRWARLLVDGDVATVSYPLQKIAFSLGSYIFVRR